MSENQETENLRSPRFGLNILYHRDYAKLDCEFYAAHATERCRELHGQPHGLSGGSPGPIGGSLGPSEGSHGPRWDHSTFILPSIINLVCLHGLLIKLAK